MALATTSPANQGPWTAEPLRGRSTSFFWSQATLASPGLRPALRSSPVSRPSPLPSPSSTVGDSLGALGSLLPVATGFFGSSSPLSRTRNQVPAPAARTTASAAATTMPVFPLRNPPPKPGPPGAGAPGYCCCG
ncbi:hypothetical protein SBADM41S_02001 [Streptomyces badius]